MQFSVQKVTVGSNRKCNYNGRKLASLKTTSVFFLVIFNKKGHFRIGMFYYLSFRFILLSSFWYFLMQEIEIMIKTQLQLVLLRIWWVHRRKLHSIMCIYFFIFYIVSIVIVCSFAKKKVCPGCLSW